MFDIKYIVIVFNNIIQYYLYNNYFKINILKLLEFNNYIINYFNFIIYFIYYVNIL